MIILTGLLATTGRFDGEYLQVGLTDVCDTPYPIMRRALREVGYGMYGKRNGTSPSRGRGDAFCHNQ